MRANPARVVWRAMAVLERDHGGPRKTQTRDILEIVDYSPTTVRQALLALRYAGIVEIADDVRGQRSWRLLPPGREKYGLPNQHSEPKLDSTPSDGVFAIASAPTHSTGLEDRGAGDEHGKERDA